MPWLLSGSPSTAIVNHQSFNHLLDFKVICCILLWNNSIYMIGHNCTIARWLESLWYSINARAFCPRTPYRAVGWAGFIMHARVNNYLWNHIICHFKVSLLLFRLIFVCAGQYDQADIPREVSGWGWPAVGLVAADFPSDMSAWPYVTTKYSYCIRYDIIIYGK